MCETEFVRYAFTPYLLTNYYETMHTCCLELRDGHGPFRRLLPCVKHETHLAGNRSLDLFTILVTHVEAPVHKINQLYHPHAP